MNIHRCEQESYPYDEDRSETVVWSASPIEWSGGKWAMYENECNPIVYKSEMEAILKVHAGHYECKGLPKEIEEKIYRP